MLQQDLKRAVCFLSLTENNYLQIFPIPDLQEQIDLQIYLYL